MIWNSHVYTVYMDLMFMWNWLWSESLLTIYMYLTLMWSWLWSGMPMCLPSNGPNINVELATVWKSHSPTVLYGPNVDVELAMVAPQEIHL